MLISCSVQSLSRVQLFETPWTSACQAFLFITNSWSLLKLMSIESVMPSKHLILCHPLLLLPSVFPSIRVFLDALRIRWPKYWSFSFNISSSNEHPRLISFRMDWLDLLAVQRTFKSLPHTTVQKRQSVVILQLIFVVLTVFQELHLIEFWLTLTTALLNLILYEIASVIFPISQMGKLRVKGLNNLPRGIQMLEWFLNSRSLKPLKHISPGLQVLFTSSFCYNSPIFSPVVSKFPRLLE